MFPFIPIILISLASGVVGGASAFIFGWLLEELEEIFRDKKTLLTGPGFSGKTSFLRHISKDKVPDKPSGAPDDYKVTGVDAVFHIVKDFGGSEGWIAGKFDEYIQESDYVLFFFDASKFIDNTEYRLDCFARVEMIDRVVKELSQTGKSPIVLLVCTHIDKVSGNYEATVENLFAGKPYAGLLKRIAYVNTVKEECVKIIIDKLKK